MKVKKILTFAFAAVLMTSMTSCGNEDGPGGDGGGNGGGTEHTEYFGVNMSGAEFGNVYPGVDGTHYGYPSKKDLEYFKGKGLRMIRFPFRWERIQSEMNGPVVDGDAVPVGVGSIVINAGKSHVVIVQSEMNGPLITTELAKMKEFVQAAEDLNMKVLLDMHNFGRYCVYSNGVNSDDNQFVVIGNAQCTVENFCDVWKKLAAEFKDYKCIWGYDIMNEPYGMLRTTPWETIAQACINAIREVDTETMLVISGNEYSSASRWKEVSDGLKNLVDPCDNMIFQAHVYFDWDASGNYSRSYDEDGATIQTGVARLRPFVEWLKENGKRGFVGEYGVPDDDGRWLDILDAALKYLQENGVNGTYWSAGPRWGDYKLAVQPTDNYTVDRPQLATLLKYKTTVQVY